ncbi:MAG: anthranilate synthase component I family protein [Limisphaerales bacterium]
MRPLIQEITTPHTPESLVENLRGERGVVLLRTSAFDLSSARYSFVVANPFLTFQSSGSRCEIVAANVNSRTVPPFDNGGYVQFGDPWQVLDALMARFELLDEIDLPFPLGGCFGYWGYDLKNFTEPKLPRRAANDLELPDCHVGFYDSLVVFDHQLGAVCVVSTGLDADGSRSEARAEEQLKFWLDKLSRVAAFVKTPAGNFTKTAAFSQTRLQSNVSRAEFIAAVERAQRYIRGGDIYQVNLSQRLTAALSVERRAPSRLGDGKSLQRAETVLGGPTLWGWELFQWLSSVSPAPFSAFFDCDDFQLASSSPELFLRLSGSHIRTKPIKGTRPRDPDPTRDAQLAYELQTSAKELAELVMITDLLRNDLGKVCEFGSIQVPELAKLEKFAQVQHLVSTVEGRLRTEVTHFAALASCFPGGSITGAPKFRAMEIIDELEPIARGPYCGCHGYLGFNRESQLSITIRTAICKDGLAHFNVGAGIVADSDPEAEYEETLAKAAGFLAALNQPQMDTEEHESIQINN